MGQIPPSATHELPKDPRAIFAAAAPFYDFAGADLKPWHLKASYQLYDENGRPTEQGVYEYWWASPTVYRSTWTRPGAQRTDWHTADGKHSFQASGAELNYFEYELPLSLLSPLPDVAALDPAKVRLDTQKLSMQNGQLSCVKIIPLRSPDSQVPIFCFDTGVPALRLRSILGVITNFNSLVAMQGHYLARQIQAGAEGHTLFTATVDEVNDLSASDEAFMLSAAASPVSIERAFAPHFDGDSLVKKQFAEYPDLAKRERITGKVILQAVVGADGRVKNLQVIASPDRSLSQSAVKAVSQWQYKPYILDGKPAEVEILLAVDFEISG